MTENVWQMSAWQFIFLGGPLMIPIFLCSVFAVGIVMEKFVYLKKVSTDIVAFKKNVFDSIRNNKVKEALQLCETNASPIAKILKAGIIKYGSSREDIKENMEDVSLYEIPKLESRLSALATIAHVSPLLGLLGTVAGMTTCFNAIYLRASAMNPVTSGDLAKGIFEALATTLAGLLIAIPTYITYNYFVGRVHYFVIEMERAATELVNLMCQAHEINS